MTLPRTHLLEALRADLIGPYDPDSGHEVLEFPPIRWYLTGFLVPEASARNEAASSGDEDEDYSAGDEPGGEDTPSSEPEAKHRPILPSSLGLSVLLPPAPAAGPDAVPDTVRVQLSWGEYVPVSTNDEVAALCAARGLDPRKHVREGKPPKMLWDRVPIPDKTITLELSAGTPGALQVQPVPDAPGVHIEYRIEAIDAADATALRIGEPGQPARALSVFVVGLSRPSFLHHHQHHASPVRLDDHRPGLLPSTEAYPLTRCRSSSATRR